MLSVDYVGFLFCFRITFINQHRGGKCVNAWKRFIRTPSQNVLWFGSYRVVIVTRSIIDPIGSAICICLEAEGWSSLLDNSKIRFSVTLESSWWISMKFETLTVVKTAFLPSSKVPTFSRDSTWNRALSIRKDMRAHKSVVEKEKRNEMYQQLFKYPIYLIKYQESRCSQIFSKFQLWTAKPAKRM